MSKTRERTIREIDGDDDVTLEDARSVGLKLRDALEAEKSAKAIAKSAGETVKSLTDQLYLMVGARVEDRPLLDGGEESDE